MSAWNISNPPQDGTTIVAIGRVIITEDICTSVDPFIGAIYWEKDSSGFEGWHYRSTGLTVARALDDEVLIDFWHLFPVTPTINQEAA